ncbi:MAG TPA: stage II sporulation protein M [Planctomycetaceae bacterium]|nr:stage II sporulation protein M [Planctomycetaceae bacterium]
MKVSDLLESRRVKWKALEMLCERLEGRGRRRLDAATVVRFSSLYRSACADLALADAYQLPRETIRYLHQLVGRAHNQLYRSRLFRLSTWSRQLLVDVPRQLFNDWSLRLAFCIFWGVFVLSAALGYSRPEFAQQVVGKETIESVEENYSQPVNDENPAFRGFMLGYYVLNNAGIGLRCFALGIVFGVGGLLITVFNAALLGGLFGHMATTAQSGNFFEFVTAHGPYELTAVVMASAAGMRLGFSLLYTKGRTRIDSLRRAAREAMPTMGAFVILFVLAALIEAFVSPSPLPYAFKMAVCVFSAASLVFYVFVLGYPRGDRLPAENVWEAGTSPFGPSGASVNLGEGRHAVG